MNIILSIAALGLLIILHEAGHFFLARWCGMKVYEFSVGFGPRLWYTRMGETEFSLRVIFLGGYVRVAGMHPAEEDAKDPGSFLSSAPWKRFLMIIAGPIANYLTAIFLFFLIFGGWGTRDAEVLVQGVKANTPLASAGLAKGDRILQINKEPIVDRAPQMPSRQFSDLLLERLEKGVQLVIVRSGKRYKVSLPKIEQRNAGKVGLEIEDAETLLVSDVTKSSPAYQLGLRKGDQIIAINGKPVLDPKTFSRYAKEAKEKGMSLQLLRGHKLLTLEKKGKAPAARRAAPADRREATPNQPKPAARPSTRKPAAKPAARPALTPRKTPPPARRSKPAASKKEPAARKKEPAARKVPKAHPAVDTGAVLRAWGLVLSSFYQVEIKKVKTGSLAQAAGLNVGDRVLQVDDKPLVYQPARSALQQVKEAFGQCQSAKAPIPFQVSRDGKAVPLKLPPQKGGCTKGLKVRPTVWILVLQTFPKTVAQKIGLKPGDRIITIDGERISGFHHLLSQLKHRISRPIKITFERKGKLLSATAPMAKAPDKWRLGFQPQLDFPLKRASLAVSLQSAVIQTWRWNVKIYESLVKVFTGREKANFTGPVGIVQMAQQTVKRGANYFLMFVAIISIHLAFFNLLPIPALDGGRLMFLFTQQLLRLFGAKEEVGVRIEMVANLIGFFLLFGLLIFITFKDVARIIRGIFGAG